MADLKPLQESQIKRQEIPHSEFVNPFTQKTLTFNNPHNNLIFEPTSIFKNHFEAQMAFNWINSTPIFSHYNPCYGHFDPHYHNHHLNLSPFMSYPSKHPKDFNVLARTNDGMQSPIFTGGISYSQFNQIPISPINQYSQAISAPRGWVVDQEQVEYSVEQPDIKQQNDSEQEQALRQKRRKSKMKNQTKNIPKNYGKAMITFILSHLDWIQSQFGIQRRQDLVSELKKRKNSINAIVHLKELWTTSKYAKQFRILSNLFIRKYSFAYIFNSRVSNFSTHIKYKYKLQEALRSPGNFSRIKEY